MRSRPTPVMMRLGHRLTGGRLPPPDEGLVAPRAFDDAGRRPVRCDADEALLPAARDVRSAARDVRSPARPDAPEGDEPREEERLGEFLRWSATPPRYRAAASGRA